MQLAHIDLGKLIAESGGDPWAINTSLQRGRPEQIFGLAQAFHNAGQCTSEASNAFAEARRRFEAAWNRDNGEHPINDSAEVQRMIQTLGAQAAQLPKIAVDLENVAATLAEAQRTCGTLISTLEAQLEDLDHRLGQALQLEKTGHLSQADQSAVDAFIAALEQQAIDDTKDAYYQLLSIRNGYSDFLEKSWANLRTDGYDPANIHELDGQDAKDPAGADNSPSGSGTSELDEIKRVTNQAVVDQMAKVRAAQQALDDAVATAYTKGPGSAEGQDALARLPQLKKDLADALNDLGNLPDYTNIDPSTVHAGPDGQFVFGYTTNGQPVQVTGQLKNGTGEIFDEGTLTYCMFQDGRLVGTRTLDSGRVEATAEPLFTAVTLAVGAPELKAGGEAAWQGLKTLFTREALTSGADITSANVLPRAVALAETRAESAAQYLAEHSPTSVSPITAADHPPPVAAAEHPAPPTSHEPAVAGPSAHGVVPAIEAPHPLPPESPLFDGYHPIEPGPEFTAADGSLIYPDDSLASKPYAIPGTVIPHANLPAGTELGRFGYPGGAYLAPEGTRFAELSLPPDSALKPYLRYVVDDPTALPPGWSIEQSQAAPWFHQPGGGTQYRIIAPPEERPTVQRLVDFGYLKVVVKK